MSEIINHEEAEHLAILKQGESNLARCYLDALSELRRMRAELADLKEGRSAIIPHSRDHAEKLLFMAETFWNGNQHVEGWRNRK